MAGGAQGLSVLFLGVDSCTPTKGENTASFVVDGRVVIDTGWFLVDRLLAADVDPLDIEAVLLTHCHHDHIIGLPQLIFYHGIKRSTRLLRIYGPAGEIGRVADDAQRYLQFDRYPELRFPIETIDVSPGDAFPIRGLEVATCAARHGVPGLCYRIESASGASAVFSGDTAFNPDLIELARGADLLVHEASHGAASTRDQEGAGHSGAPDAAEIARQAGVQRLALVHCVGAARQAALDAARDIFPSTFLARGAECVMVQPEGTSG